MAMQWLHVLTLIIAVIYSVIAQHGVTLSNEENTTWEQLGGNTSHMNHSQVQHHLHKGVHVVSWNFPYVATPLVFCIFVLAVAILKLLFHYAEWLTTIIPESCVLIVFGVVVGAVIQFGLPESVKKSISFVDDFKLEPQMFMLFLLPPIVLDSAYSLNDHTFADNIGTILLYAVLGTVLNCFMIGPMLYGLAYSGVLGDINITLTQCLLFSSFIVAVDPVAVLAIFKEVGVNNVLYFLVFGESLLNDAVTVVLYNMMRAFNQMDVIPITEILLGLASFFTVSLGGLSIGILYGILTALLTRTTSIVRIVEPLIVLVMAYLSYISAELFHWSGIISMIGCGITQAHYAFHNISERSLTTVNYFVKMISSLSDAIIFLFLGLEVVRTEHVWHTGFVICSLILCLVCRLITVFGLTYLSNKRRVKIISYQEQFIMWYGGLRGAVCFALAATLGEEFEHKNLFLTTTLFVVFFTVFIQGITIKPLVGLLEIQRKHRDESNSLAVEFQTNVSVHVTAGVEVIIGNQSTSDLKDLIYRLNDRYLRHWLQNNPKTREEQFLEMYQKIAIKDHVAHIYEATSHVVVMNEFSAGTDDELPKLPFEDPEESDRRKSAPAKNMDYDDLVTIMGKSYNQNFAKAFSGDLGGNSNDIVAKLRQKHARLKENKLLRTPTNSPHVSERRGIRVGNRDSVTSDTSTLYEQEMMERRPSLASQKINGSLPTRPWSLTRRMGSGGAKHTTWTKPTVVNEVPPDGSVEPAAPQPDGPPPYSGSTQRILDETSAATGAANIAFEGDLEAADGEHKTVISIIGDPKPKSQGYPSGKDGKDDNGDSNRKTKYNTKC